MSLQILLPSAVFYGLGCIWNFRNIARKFSEQDIRHPGRTFTWGDAIFNGILGLAICWTWPLVLLGRGIHAFTPSPLNFAYKIYGLPRPTQNPKTGERP